MPSELVALVKAPSDELPNLNKEIIIKTLITTASIIFCLSWPFLSIAEASPDHASPTMPAAFDTMKKLLGHWEGTTREGDQDMPVTIIYELTSGGTAIKQTMMPGTSQEMVSMYHKSGDSLAMSHYCTLGNQPFMTLQSVSDSSIAFAMEQPIGITSKEEPHMHAVSLSINSDGSLQEEWVLYTNQQEAHRKLFSLNRKP